jgi:very-short-patch-repair endonuclease
VDADAKRRQTEGGHMPNLRARELRWNMTDAERKLWLILRRKQLAGFRFRRQATLGPYVADFLCAKTRLVVELDGASHTSDKQIAHDERRTRWMIAHGLRVVRFTNRELFENADRVADAIYLAASAPFRLASLARHLPPQGGKE